MLKDLTDSPPIKKQRPHNAQSKGGPLSSVEDAVPDWELGAGRSAASGHEKNNVAMNAVPGDPGSISFGAADQTAWLAQTQSMWATRSRKVRSRHN
jgi:hypothetical protein